MRPARPSNRLRVRDGRVQKKNNWTPDQGDYYARAQSEIRIDRRDPGIGHRHVLTIAQLRRFIALLPNWDEVAVGLKAIVIDEGSWYEMGWYTPGVVAVCAWETDLWGEASPHWIKDNQHLLDLLDVRMEKRNGRPWLLWTEEQARAYTLLDVLPHELGHHHDLMTTRSKRDAARGERYAIAYAREVLDQVWPTYTRHFEL
jgi:hypothetical protein